MAARRRRTDNGSTEQELVDAWRAGNSEAFDTIFRRHYGRLLRQAERRLGSRSEAEDAVQEAMERALRSAGGFGANGEYQIGAWLSRIVTNRCHDHGQRRAVEERALRQVSLDAARSESAPDPELLDMVEDAIADLPDSQREAFVLRVVDDLSYAELASTAGISRDNARARVHRARTAIRDHLAGAGVGVAGIFGLGRGFGGRPGGLFARARSARPGGRLGQSGVADVLTSPVVTNASMQAAPAVNLFGHGAPIVAGMVATIATVATLVAPSQPARPALSSVAVGAAAAAPSPTSDPHTMGAVQPATPGAQAAPAPSTTSTSTATSTTISTSITASRPAALASPAAAVSPMADWLSKALRPTVDASTSTTTANPMVAAPSGGAPAPACPWLDRPLSSLTAPPDPQATVVSTIQTAAYPLPTVGSTPSVGMVPAQIQSQLPSSTPANHASPSSASPSSTTPTTTSSDPATATGRPTPGPGSTVTTTVSPAVPVELTLQGCVAPVQSALVVRIWGLTAAPLLVEGGLVTTTSVGGTTGYVFRGKAFEADGSALPGLVGGAFVGQLTITEPDNTAQLSLAFLR